MREGRFDLGLDIASFDFFWWLIIARSTGIERVVFKIDAPKQTKWPSETVLRRFRSIIEPGPALLDMPYRIGAGGEWPIVHPSMKSFVEWYGHGRKFKRLRSILPPQPVKYTVTLRNTARGPARNSNAAAWRKFADTIGAVLIEDYDDQPIHLHERMALYAGAAMNFGINTGPMTILSLTDYPAAIFGPQIDASTIVRCGIAEGGQMPWARANQRWVWQPDDYDTLMRWFEDWQR